MSAILKFLRRQCHAELLISSGAQKTMSPLKKMGDEAQEMTLYFYYLRNVPKLCYKKPAQGLDR